MKWFQIYKSFKIKKFINFKDSKYFILHNEQELEQLKVFSNITHSYTIKILRKLKTPQHNKIYVLRNKKGFNTIMFQQKYDVFITNSKGVVIDSLSAVETGFISKYYPKGFMIYFAIVGTINFYNIQIKDTIKLRRDWL